MSVLFILIVVSITVAGVFLGAYLWSVTSGQYEDMESPAVRILLDDKVTKSKDKLSNQSPNKK